MAKEYVVESAGRYWIRDTRVSLDSIVYAFLRGDSPDSIADAFPSVGLESVYGALTHYLAHRDELDEYLSREREEFQRLRAESKAAHPGLYAKLQRV